MHEITVAVIIPVWNTPDWMLKQCIESVLGQTHKLHQIIVIDDGSDSEETLSYFKEIESESTVELIHIAHSGISAARNAGIDRLDSEWFTFLDSDDYWDDDFIESLVSSVKSDTQIVFCGNSRADYNGQRVLRKEPSAKVMNDIKRIPYFSCGTGSRLWNTCFVKGLGEIGRYPVNCIAEDETFGEFVIASASNIVSVEQYGYNVRSRDDSFCRSRRKFNSSTLEQMPFSAIKNNLADVVPAGQWQKDVLYCRVIDDMMGLSWIFCCYSDKEQRKKIAREAAGVIREHVPDYESLRKTEAFRILWNGTRGTAVKFYIFCVKNHMENTAQNVCTALLRLYYKVKKIQ